MTDLPGPSCVIDPARYSDRAVVVIEMDPAAYDEASDADLDDMRQGLATRLGMDVIILIGARLARIEEPTDG